jgi:glycosidase
VGTGFLIAADAIVGRSWGGDQMGVIKQADVFQSLGVTALWLSPLLEQVDVIL